MLFSIVAGMPGLAAITVESIAEKLITTGLVALVTSAVTLAVLKSQLKGLTSRVDKLDDAVALHSERLAHLANERTQCELRAAYQFSTRADISRLTSDQITQYQRLLDRLDEMAEQSNRQIAQVHDRVTKLATSLAELRGMEQGKE